MRNIENFEHQEKKWITEAKSRSKKLNRHVSEDLIHSGPVFRRKKELLNKVSVERLKRLPESEYRFPKKLRDSDENYNKMMKLKYKKMKK